MSTDRVHGPQASRMLGHLRAAPRSERAMTILDLLRTRGSLSTDEVRDALGHANVNTVARHLGDLEAEGLVEIVSSARRGRAPRPAVWAITTYGRTVA